jgi:hypothetical protein
MFDTMGARGFGERARIHLLATGGRARKHERWSTGAHAQEARIARDQRRRIEAAHAPDERKVLAHFDERSVHFETVLEWRP